MNELHAQFIASVFPPNFNFHFLSASSSLSTSQFPFSSPLALPDYTSCFHFPPLLPASLPAATSCIPLPASPLSASISNYIFQLLFPSFSSHLSKFPVPASGFSYPFQPQTSPTDLWGQYGSNHICAVFLVHQGSLKLYFKDTFKRERHKRWKSG